MNQLFKNSISTVGRVMFYEDSVVWKSFKGKIYKSEDNGKTWDIFFDLRGSLSSLLMDNFAIASRLLRGGVHHLIPINKNELFVIYNKQTAIIKNGGLKDYGKLFGSRPLAVLEYDGKVLYGEYRGNPDRSEISIWNLNLKCSDS